MKPVPLTKRFAETLAAERWLEESPQRSRRAPLACAGYPAPYRIGMSNLGFHFVLGRLMRSPALRVERFFSDSSPLTVEGGARIASAAILFVSISYEEDYLNLARILAQSGIEPRRQLRRCRPLIIAGGSAVSANPYPIAGMVDCFVLGEGEQPLDGIIGALEENRGAPTEAFLAGIADIPGVFVPAIPGATPRHVASGADASFPHSVIVTPETVFADTLLVEIARGCPGACAFCLASALYGPYRSLSLRSFVSLLAALDDLPSSVGFVSTAALAHPDFAALVEACRSRGARVALPSLRAEDFDDEKADLIARIGAKSVSFAPESGSESLRFRLGKAVPNETYLRWAGRLRAGGVRLFRLYLLVGCPGETDRDLEETRLFLAEFTRAIGDCRLSISVNTVIPKAWTPLQFYPMPPEETLEARQRSLRRICVELGLSFRMKKVRSAIRQAMLSLGDERVGDAILRYTEGRASWRRALGEAGIDPRLPHLPRGLDTPLPWDRIEGPVDRRLLVRRYRRLVELSGSRGR